MLQERTGHTWQMAAYARCELSTITLAKPIGPLPPDNPADAIDWNAEKRRDAGMGVSDLKGWFLVSVREEVESYEAFVIQDRWPDSQGPPMWTNENRARYDRSHLRYISAGTKPVP